MKPTGLFLTCQQYLIKIDATEVAEHIGIERRHAVNYRKRHAKSLWRNE